MKNEVVVVIGTGGIGMAIARRQGFGRHILLADFNEKLLEDAAKELEVASYKVSSLKIDVSSRESVRALADNPSRGKVGPAHRGYSGEDSLHAAAGHVIFCGSLDAETRGSGIG
jgi:NAD(P)-dependent dehydrogenase (short-subunit alcohol dehydrogenase family)